MALQAVSGIISLTGFMVSRNILTFSSFKGITKAVGAANYLFWLSELQPSIRETEENRFIGLDESCPLELKDVAFSYPLRPQARVLRGIDLEVRIHCIQLMIPYSNMRNNRSNRVSLRHLLALQVAARAP